MLRICKTLMLWLLLATLPLQGMAAVVSACCAKVEHASHSGAGHANHAAAAQETTAAHHETAQHMHAHQDVDEHIQHMSADQDAGYADQAPDVPHKHSSTSNCTGCAIGSPALPSASLTIANASLNRFSAVGPISPVAGFIPGALERPPKHLPA